MYVQLRIFYIHRFVQQENTCLGKARRLKQAKEEAQAEVEAYRQERERDYKDHERKVSLMQNCLVF